MIVAADQLWLVTRSAAAVVDLQLSRLLTL